MSSTFRPCSRVVREIHPEVCFTAPQSAKKLSCCSITIASSYLVGIEQANWDVYRNDFEIHGTLDKIRKFGDLPNGRAPRLYDYNGPTISRCTVDAGDTHRAYLLKPDASKFNGVLYRNAREVHRAVAVDWVSAGGENCYWDAKNWGPLIQRGARQDP